MASSRRGGESGGGLEEAKEEDGAALVVPQEGGADVAVMAEQERPVRGVSAAGGRNDGEYGAEESGKGRGGVLLPSAAHEETEEKVEITDCSTDGMPEHGEKGEGGGGKSDDDLQGSRSEAGSSFAGTCSGRSSDELKDDDDGDWAGRKAMFGEGERQGVPAEVGAADASTSGRSRKPLNMEWKSYRRAIEWRCRWLELRMMQIQMQAERYERVYQRLRSSKAVCKWRTRSEDEDRKDNFYERWDGGGAPSMGETVGAISARTHAYWSNNRLVKRTKVLRRKRRRREEDKDLVAYFAVHPLYSRYEKSHRKGLSGQTIEEDMNDREDKECGHAWGRSDSLRQGAGMQRRGGADDSACSSGSDAEDVFENLLGVIDTLHIRVENLRNQLGRNHSSRKAAAARLLALQLQQPNPPPPSTCVPAAVQQSAPSIACTSPSKRFAAELGSHVVKSESAAGKAQVIGAGDGGRLSAAISGQQAAQQLRSLTSVPVTTGLLESRTVNLAERSGEDIMTTAVTVPGSTSTICEAFVAGTRVAGGSNPMGISRHGFATAVGQVDQNCRDHNDNLCTQMCHQRNGVFNTSLVMGNEALVPATKGLPVEFHQALELEQVMGGMPGSLKGKDAVHCSHSNGLEGLAATFGNDGSEDGADDIGMYLVSTGGDCSPLQRCLFLSGKDGEEQATERLTQATEFPSNNQESETGGVEEGKNARGCSIKPIGETWPTGVESGEGRVALSGCSTWHDIENGLLLGFSAENRNCPSSPVTLDVAVPTSPSKMDSQSESHSLSQSLPMTQAESHVEGQLQPLLALDDQPTKSAFPQGKRRRRDCGGIAQGGGSPNGLLVLVPIAAMDIPRSIASPRSVGGGSRRCKGQAEEKEKENEREKKGGSFGSTSNTNSNGPEDTIAGSATVSMGAVVSPARRETRALARQAAGLVIPKVESDVSTLVSVVSKAGITKEAGKAGKVVPLRGRGKALSTAKGSSAG